MCKELIENFVFFNPQSNDCVVIVIACGGRAGGGRRAGGPNLVRTISQWILKLHISNFVYLWPIAQSCARSWSHDLLTFFKVKKHKKEKNILQFSPVNIKVGTFKFGIYITHNFKLHNIKGPFHLSEGHKQQWIFRPKSWSFSRSQIAKKKKTKNIFQFCPEQISVNIKVTKFKFGIHMTDNIKFCNVKVT